MTLLAKQNAHELDQYIKFFPVEHKYTFRDQNINRSVTELVHQQFPRFNADTVAEQMSRKHYNNKKNQYYQKTKEDILQLWEDNKNDACSKGTDLHQCIEYVYNAEEERTNADLDYEANKEARSDQKEYNLDQQILSMQNNASFLGAAAAFGLDKTGLGSRLGG